MNIQLCNDASWIFSKEEFDIYRDCMYLPTYNKYVAEMEAFMRSSSVKVYMCHDVKKVVGILIIRIVCSRSAEIEGIAVSYEYRNRGIGKMLITEARKAERLKKIIAQTDEEAVGFYQSCGFQIEPERKEYLNGSVVRYNCLL